MWHAYACVEHTMYDIYICIYIYSRNAAVNSLVWSSLTLVPLCELLIDQQVHVPICIIQIGLVG